MGSHIGNPIKEAIDLQLIQPLIKKLEDDLKPSGRTPTSLDDFCASDEEMEDFWARNERLRKKIYPLDGEGVLKYMPFVNAHYKREKLPAFVQALMDMERKMRG